MYGPDSTGFLKAMELETVTLIEMDTFSVISRTSKIKVISSVWAFKVKFSLMDFSGLDYFKTFSPAIQEWLTVCLILVMTILLGLENQHIDSTPAFVQAPIDTDVYVEMPRLFSTPGKVWKLKKSIYGLKQSPRIYFLHMKGKLKN